MLPVLTIFSYGSFWCGVYCSDDMNPRYNMAKPESPGPNSTAWPANDLFCGDLTGQPHDGYSMFNIAIMSIL